MDRAALRVARLAVAARLVLAGVVAAATATVTLCPAAAHAAPDVAQKIRERLREGRRLYDEQEYRKAIRELAPINRADAATRAQKLEALELIGLSWFILGDEAEAREAFEDILAIDAGYELREASGSPKIRAFFQKVKKGYLPDYRPGSEVTLELSAPESGTAGQRLEITVYVTSGLQLVKLVGLTERRSGMTSYLLGTKLERVSGNQYRYRTTAHRQSVDYEFEYYVQAVGFDGHDVARLGGPENPLRIPIRGVPDTSSWYGKWYVWVGAGLLVAGTTTALILLSGDTAPDGTLGPPIDLSQR